MKRYLTRVLAWLCALACLASTLIITSLPVHANMSDQFADKYVIFEGEKTVKWSKGSHVIWSTSGFDVEVSEDLPEDKAGIYIRIELDAAAAAALNTAGATMVGQNLAARQYSRVKKIMGALAVIVFSVSYYYTILSKKYI